MKDPIVFDKTLQIDRVQLGEEGVQEAAAFFAAAGDDLHVVRGDDDTGQAANMLGETFAGLIIGKQLFFTVLPQDADHFQGLALLLKLSFDAKAGDAGRVRTNQRFVVRRTDIRLRRFMYAELVLPGKIALSKAKVIDGIQQIGLANAIAAADAYDPLGKVEGGLFVVFELHQ